MTESERSMHRDILYGESDYTRRAGETYRRNVQADFREVSQIVGLGMDAHPFPTVTVYVKNSETGEDEAVDKPGIIVDLPFNRLRREIAVVDPQGVLQILRFSEDNPTILHPGSEASIDLYANAAAQAAVKDAIRNAASSDISDES